jgi:hypothetical protein
VENITDLFHHLEKVHNIGLVEHAGRISIINGRERSTEHPHAFKWISARYANHLRRKEVKRPPTDIINRRTPVE